MQSPQASQFFVVAGAGVTPAGGGVALGLRIVKEALHSASVVVKERVYLTL